MPTVYIETHGCSNSKAESEIMAGLLSRSGFTPVCSADHADLLVLNTCIVKEPTENKMRARIIALARMHKPLIIAGCMPEVRYEEIRELAPNASLVSTHHVEKIAFAAARVLDGKRVELIGKRQQQLLCQPRIRQNPIIEIVPISTGCLSACSYCIVKQVKGDLRSYSTERIIQEIKYAKKAGCKEFWMTGQDCSCWGFDIGSNLAELLEQITTEVSGKYFIRVGMLNPAHLRKFYPQLIEAYEDEHIFKFVHIPVQSGSDEILQAMGRGYSTKDFKRIVSAFRTAFPQLQLWTDIIVGFPGETDVDFRRSLELIKEIKPDYVNVSKFGARMGTPAAKLEPLSGKVVAQRSRLISKIVDEMIVEQNQRWLGWSGSVLIDEFNQAKRSWIGRNFAYKPIILETENRLGTWVNVKIVRAEKNLIGVLE